MSVNKLTNKIINDDIDRIIAEDLPWDRFLNAKVLVTGASGMIPSYVVYTLLGLNDALQLNIHVIALVRNESKAKQVFGDVLIRDDITLLVQDVTQPIDADLSVDYIIHGASPARPSEHRDHPANTIRANLIGTFNLLDLAAHNAPCEFVLMSSSEVYGSVEGVSIISESDYGRLDCTDPRACYSEGKRAAEAICASYNAQFGVRCTIPRFAHIYGPGLALDDGRVQADFAANVLRGENIVMKSDGSSQRAYTYVSDAVAGMFYALLKGNGEAYNIADSGNIISIRQLAESFIASCPEKALKLVIDIDKNTSGMYNPAKFIGLDNTKIKELGWMPKVDIYEGTRRMVRSYEGR